MIAWHVHVPRWVRYILYGALVLGALHLILLIVFRPSHDRVWELGQEKLPHFLVSGDSVTIENFRNFDWREDKSADIRYETRDFDLSMIETVDVFISHFDDFEGLAHIFLSFGFSDGRHVVVSFETRREKGETFSPWWGLLRQFETIYVVGSEEDIVGLRTDVRDERVYLYPTKASSGQVRELFLRVVSDINAIYEKPRMYNTLTHNCTNALTRRVEDISSVEFPLTWKTLLPGYFDEVLYELGIIATDADFASVKGRHRLDNTAVSRKNSTYSADLRATHAAGSLNAL